MKRKLQSNLRLAIMIKSLVFKAIAIGIVVDFFGSVAVGIGLAAVAAVLASATSDPSPEHTKALVAGFYLKLAGLVGTTFFTGFGAYLAANRSRPNGLANAIAVGVISLSLSVSLALWKPGITPEWKLIAGILLTLPAAFAGGWFSKKQNVA